MAECTVILPKSALSETELKRFSSFARDAKQTKMNFYEVTRSDEGTAGMHQVVFDDMFSGNDAGILAAQSALRDWVAGRTRLDEDGAPGKDRVEVQQSMSYTANGKNNGMLKRVMKLLSGEGYFTEEEKTDGRLRNTIGMAMVLNNMKSATDLLNAIEEDSSVENNKRVKKLRDTDEEEGTSVARVRLASNIGREYLKAKGLSSVDAKGNRVGSLTKQTAVGEEILNSMEEQGLIVTQEKGMFAAGGILASDSTRMSGTSPVTVGKTVRLNNEAFNKVNRLAGKGVTDNKGLNAAGKNNKKAMTDIVNELLLITTRQTEGTPQAEPQEINRSIQKTALNKVMESAVADYLQKGGFEMGDGVSKFYDEMYEIWQDSAGVDSAGEVQLDDRQQTFMSKVREKYKLNQSDTLEKGLGLNLPSKYAEMTNGHTGENITAKSGLVNLMMNWDELGSNPFYYSYFYAGNTRLFLNEVSAQFQASKAMRESIRAAVPTNYSGKDADNFVKRLIKHSGLIKEAIEVEGTPALEELIQRYEKGENIMPYVVDSLNTTGMTITNAMDVISIVQTISEIRKGNDGEFTSGWLSESDASASGLVLKIIQNLANPEVQDMLAQMYPNADGVIEAKDAYAFATSHLSNMVEDAKDELIEFKDNPTGKAGASVIELARMRKLAKLDYTGREVMKYLIMQFMYGQTNKNNKIDFGKTLTDKIVGRGADPEGIIAAWDVFSEEGADKLDLSNYEMNKDGNLTRGAVDELTKELSQMVSNSSGEFLLKSVLTPVYEERFKENTDQIEALAVMISSVTGTEVEGDTTTDTVNIMSALRVMDSVGKDGKMGKVDMSEQGFKVGLDKTFETLIQGTYDMLVPLRHTNINSAKVVPIHVMDAAILMRTIKQTYDQLLTTAQKKELKRYTADMKEFMDKNPMAPIHDAVKIPPMIAEVFEKNYEQNVLDVSYYYDIPTQLLAELDYKMSLPGAKLPSNVVNALVGLRAKVDANFKARQKYMDDTLRNADGTWNTIPNSFAEDLSDQAIAYEAVEYTKRVGKIPKTEKKAPKANKKAESATTNNNDISPEVQAAMVEMKELMQDGDVLTYDLETDGLIKSGDATGINILQLGYTNGQDINENMYVKQKMSVLKAYIANMKDTAAIANSQVYKDIEEYVLHRTGPYRDAVPVGKAMAKFSKDAKGKKVSGYNNIGYDDKVIREVRGMSAFKSDYDMRALAVANTTDYEADDYTPGKLDRAQTEVTGAGEHTAMYDAQVTHKMGEELAEGTKPEFAPVTSVDNVLKDINYSELSDDSKELYDTVDKFIKANPKIVFNVAEKSQYRAKDGNEAIDVANTEGGQEFIRELAHEINHASTYSYIVENGNTRAVKYVKQLVNRMGKLTDGAPKLVKDRLSHVSETLKTKGEIAAAAELVAILNSEPDVANALFTHLAIKPGNGVVIGKLKEIMKAAMDFAKNALKLDISEDGKVDAEQLFTAVEMIKQEGQARRTAGGKALDTTLNAKQSEFRMKDKGFKKPDVDQNRIDPITRFITDSNEMMADVISSGFETAKPFSKEVAETVHNQLKGNDMYDLTVGTIADGLHDITKSKAYQTMRNYVYMDPKVKKILEQLGADDLNSRKDMNEMMTTQTQRLEDKIESAGYKTDEQLALVDDVFARGGLFGLYKNKVLKGLVEGDTLLADEIAMAEQELTRQFGDIEVAKNMSNMYLGKLEEGIVPANIEGNMVDRGTEAYGAYEKLIGLYSLESTEGSIELLQDMYNNQRELFDILVNTGTQLRALDNEIHSILQGKNKVKDYNLSRGNLIDDISRYNYKIVPITLGDYKSSKFIEKEGWKVLREPTENSLGMVYQSTTDSIQDGIGTINYIKTGVTVDTEMALSEKYKNSAYVESPGGIDGATTRYALSLTSAERDKVGFYRNPAQSLIRAFAHKQRVLATQNLRDDITEGLSQTFGEINTLNDTVDALIDEGEHPIFLKVPDAWNYNARGDANEFSQKIRDNYELVDKSLLSDVGGYNERFTLIRTDVSETIQGYHEKGLFNNRKLNKVLSVVKRGVRYGKTVLIILNPPKIALDFTAGVALAMAKGASFQEAFVYGREAIQGTRRISKILNDRVRNDFELAMYANLDSPTGEEIRMRRMLERQKIRLDNDLKNDKFSAAYFHGFMQSLGTDIISRDRDSAQGLQVAIEDVISKLTKDDMGSYTAFNKYVKKFANMGGDQFNVSYVYNSLSDRLSNLKDGETAANVLDNMASDMNNVRNKDDMTKYIAELVAAPNSALVRFGGAMTVYADLLPRWMIYRHNINVNKMSDEDAAGDALDALPNYMFGMPSVLKPLSDLYVTPFPSFYMRIQRTILALVTKHPVSFGTQLVTSDMLAEMFGISGTSIISSNILNKLYNWSVLSDPLDLPFAPYSNIGG